MGKILTFILLIIGFITCSFFIYFIIKASFHGGVIILNFNFFGEMFIELIFMMSIAIFYIIAIKDEYHQLDSSIDKKS